MNLRFGTTVCTPRPCRLHYPKLVPRGVAEYLLTETLKALEDPYNRFQNIRGAQGTCLNSPRRKCHEIQVASFSGRQTFWYAAYRQTKMSSFRFKWLRFGRNLVASIPFPSSSKLLYGRSLLQSESCRSSWQSCLHVSKNNFVTKCGTIRSF